MNCEQEQRPGRRPAHPLACHSRREGSSRRRACRAQKCTASTQINAKKGGIKNARMVSLRLSLPETRAKVGAAASFCQHVLSRNFSGLPR